MDTTVTNYGDWYIKLLKRWKEKNNNNNKKPHREEGVYNNKNYRVRGSSVEQTFSAVYMYSYEYLNVFINTEKLNYSYFKVTVDLDD